MWQQLIYNFIQLLYVNQLFSHSVPPPHLTLTITPSTTPLYECTPVNLTCSATLDTSVVNTAVTVSSVWTGPSGEQLTNSSHITVMDMLHSSPYTSVVVFDQVDSGDYQCNITISPADNNVLPAMGSTTIQLTVTGTAILYIHAILCIKLSIWSYSFAFRDLKP